MNQKNISILTIFIAIILIGVALYFVKINRAGQPVMPSPAVHPSGEDENSKNTANKITNLTYLVSKEDKTKFCNGAVMDSEGYRKTISTEVVFDVPLAGLDESTVVKQVAVLATDGMCQDVLKQTDFKVKDGVVDISPIEGWAGVSIAMCACKPQVEVNLLRLPGIKQVVWLSD